LIFFFFFFFVFSLLNFILKKDTMILIFNKYHITLADEDLELLPLDIHVLVLPSDKKLIITSLKPSRYIYQASNSANKFVWTFDHTFLLIYFY
jgi:hypothetical protein